MIWRMTKMTDFKGNLTINGNFSYFYWEIFKNPL